MTGLDQAFQAMEDAPDDDRLRLRFFERLADGELFVLLEREADGDAVTPEVFELEDGPMVLVFDREDRLAEFIGAPSPFAALPGRVIAQHLAGQGIGMGLNLGVAPSSYVIPAEAVEWLAATLGHAPVQTEARPVSFHAPGGLPEALLESLDAKLARAQGLAVAALLAGVRYEGGRQGHMLAFVGALPGAEPALARAAAEALTFSGVEAGVMDVAFLDAGDASLGALTRVALRFDLPLPVAPDPAAPPGTDPDRPPRLR